MKKIILSIVMAAVSVASAAYYQLPTVAELIGYPYPTQVQFVVQSNDGTTQTGLAFAEGRQGGGRGGSIWNNAACATVQWDESGNLLGYQVEKTENSRTYVPASWCFGS
jgi:hypothetical protein